MTTVPEPRGALLVDIGSLLTRVTFVDAVEGETRVIGQAAHETTIDGPYHDPLIAIVRAAASIGERTGRQLVADGRLIVPRNAGGDGVSRVVLVTSAGPIMRVVIAAVGSDTSARSAQRALDATYTSVIERITLDDALDAASDMSWIERQARRLVGERPDCVLIVGGIEGGAQEGPLRLARMLALVYDVRNESQIPPPMVYAGNSLAAPRVAEALTERTVLLQATNLRPAMDHEQLAEARNTVRTIYNTRVLTQLPGSERLQSLGGQAIASAAEAAELIGRFVAERFGRRVLLLDVGAAHTILHYTRPGATDAVVAAGIGVGYGARETLVEAGAWEVARWLPYPIDDRTLVHRVLNIALRPQVMPSSREDLLLRLALARAAVSSARLRLASADDYDMIIASGGVLQHAGHPGLALLAILDALQPGSNESAVAIDVHLDELGLINSIGALAATDADAALTLFDRDLMRNTPLATCIVPLALPGVGELAISAELSVIGGETQRITVNSGAIGVLPLAPGMRGTLRLLPAAGVRLGGEAAGAEVKTDEAAISGSALGVVIDARGRPLRLATASLARQQQLWDWMHVLGAVREPLPYAAAEPFVESEVVLSAPTEIRRATSFSRESRTSEIQRTSQPAAAASSIDDDLARLRQQMQTQPPKRRGPFGRK